MSPATNLKTDHQLRPIWVSINSRIILEAFSPFAEQAQDLLLAIAEPISRPKHIHEYQLTENSLFAAVSVGLEAQEIIDALERLCKTAVPEAIIAFIKKSTDKYGRVKIILRDNKFWLNAKEDVLFELKNDSVIQGARASEEVLIVREPKNNAKYIAPRKNDSADDILDIFDEFADFDPDEFLNRINYTNPSEELPIPLQNDSIMDSQLDSVSNNIAIDTQTQNDSDDDEIMLHSIEIEKEKVDTVKQRCSDLSFPVLEEYDFHADTTNLPLDIDLKPTAKLRDYQEKSLSKLFSNGRARSGIIVLPCGSGKTLVGVTACCTIKKSAIVLCNSTLSVDQWAREFRQWSTIKHTQLARFSSEVKEKFEGEGILITTYSMIAFSGKRAAEAQEMIEFIKGREWGFLLLDEVHIVPADMFKKTLGIISSHSKLGLTATLLREDDKITHLNWLIGPKLYEANWQDLAQAGFIANVSCR